PQINHCSPVQEKKKKKKMESPKLHAVMFPWFAFGHISPFIQLSNKLASHGIKISFLSAPGNVQRISSSLNTCLPHVQIIPIEIPSVDGLPLGLQSTADMTLDMAELLKTALDQMQPQIESLLIDLKPQFVFYDFAHYWLPPIATKLGIKSMFFYVFSALSAAFGMVPARLKETGETPTLDEMKKSPPGFPSKFSKTMGTFIAQDSLYLYMSFYGNLSAYDRMSACIKGCSALVVKSCDELEAPYIEYVKTQFDKPVLSLGPIVPDPPSGALEEKWSKWLDSFPIKSVIFCSFGSETFLKDDQIKELVLGLESTGLPFFVVLNFVADGKKRLTSALPDGFEERVQGKGVVHTGWVQQPHILAHESIGCFVCHAGLSSITEALMNDCQMVLLPQKADQFCNAKLVAEDMKAGVEVIRNDADGYFRKEDLCSAVKTVMVEVDKEPGKTIRGNTEKWRKFMLDKEIHERFIENFVKDLKEMVLE
ncbi:hypothetical protein IFM89_037096, partial [Coptis chinensis]